MPAQLKSLPGMRLTEVASGNIDTHGFNPRHLNRQRSKMILEIAQLQIRPCQTSEFEAAFDVAQHIIASMPGYLGHELQRCIEQDHHYMLLVRWQSVEHHEVGFRKSTQYQEWRKLLHHFYDPFPTVLHYKQVGED